MCCIGGSSQVRLSVCLSVCVVEYQRGPVELSGAVSGIFDDEAAGSNRKYYLPDLGRLNQYVRGPFLPTIT